ISGQLINELGQMEGFIHVVRCFEDDSVPHASGTIDAARDIANMDGELLITDLIAVERRLEKLTEEWNRGGREKAEVEREQALFTRFQAVLSEDKPLRTMEITEEELKQISGFQFLTLKPMLVVLNMSEGQDAPDVSAAALHSKVVPLQGQLEMEISQLPEEEAEVFLAEYGINEPSLYRMIRESYELMGLQSFFTVGEDEVRAWTVRIGASAPEAAGVIHSDLQKGFIRAEVVSYENLSELGSMSEARDQGKLGVEGKTYIVQDGDILHVRFNV
ncbi:MAG: YchF family ATPase, partial [Chloroflexota bacterium]